jgi:ribose-phosphate pyrophosphokinase
MITANGYVITPTMFPDKTSQVWKIPDELLNSEAIYVQWDFEHEGEFIQLLQLRKLLVRCGKPGCRVFLHIPFLPYGRQDKPVSNSSCFALEVFLDSIGNWETITTIDCHSPVKKITSLYPGKAIANAIKTSGATAVCFPDAGASARYTVDQRTIVLAKERDQLTGEITRIKVEKFVVPLALEDNILIIDDICDGGRTFIEVATMLKAANPGIKVSLYVSHGIFSKGTQVLRDAGISQIFTKDGEVA